MRFAAPRRVIVRWLCDSTAETSAQSAGRIVVDSDTLTSLDAIDLRGRASRLEQLDMTLPSCSWDLSGNGGNVRASNAASIYLDASR